MLASASAAMLFATKETWIITAAVWLIAIPCTTISMRVCKRADERYATMKVDHATVIWAEQNWRQHQAVSASRWLLFAAIGVLFYSSFFTNPKGILDSVRTFTYWTKTGQNGIYNREWSTYLRWLVAGRSADPDSGCDRSAGRAYFARAVTSLCFALSGPLEFSPRTRLFPTKLRGWCSALFLPLTIMTGYVVERSLPARAARFHRGDRRSGASVFLSIRRSISVL